MKKIVFSVIILILIILISFYIFNYKVSKTGNNISINKSADNIKEYILNINSYKAKISVTINSNKNTNEYVLQQEYKAPNISKQEIIEPSNLKGVTIEYDGKDLKLTNTNLTLSKVFEGYNNIGQNVLFLNDFIEEYKNNEKSEYIELENEIIMKTQNEKNKYLSSKSLYIDKKTAKPVKMEVKDITQNITVYILYNEIEINNI